VAAAAAAAAAGQDQHTAGGAVPWLSLLSGYLLLQAIVDPPSDGSGGEGPKAAEDAGAGAGAGGVVLAQGLIRTCDIFSGAFYPEGTRRSLSAQHFFLRLWLPLQSSRKASPPYVGPYGLQEGVLPLPDAAILLSLTLLLPPVINVPMPLLAQPQIAHIPSRRPSLAAPMPAAQEAEAASDEKEEGEDGDEEEDDDDDEDEDDDEDDDDDEEDDDEEGEDEDEEREAATQNQGNDGDEAEEEEDDGLIVQPHATQYEPVHSNPVHSEPVHVDSSSHSEPVHPVPTPSDPVHAHVSAHPKTDEPPASPIQRHQSSFEASLVPPQPHPAADPSDHPRSGAVAAAPALAQAYAAVRSPRGSIGAAAGDSGSRRLSSSYSAASEPGPFTLPPQAQPGLVRAPTVFHTLEQQGQQQLGYGHDEGQTEGHRHHQGEDRGEDQGDAGMTARSGSIEEGVRPDASEPAGPVASDADGQFEQYSSTVHGMGSAASNAEGPSGSMDGTDPAGFPLDAPGSAQYLASQASGFGDSQSLSMVLSYSQVPSQNTSPMHGPTSHSQRPHGFRSNAKSPGGGHRAHSERNPVQAVEHEANNDAAHRMQHQHQQQHSDPAADPHGASTAAHQHQHHLHTQAGFHPQMDRMGFGRRVSEGGGGSLQSESFLPPLAGANNSSLGPTGSQFGMYPSLQQTAAMATAAATYKYFGPGSGPYGAYPPGMPYSSTGSQESLGPNPYGMGPYPPYPYAQIPVAYGPGGSVLHEAVDPRLYPQQYMRMTGVPYPPPPPHAHPDAGVAPMLPGAVAAARYAEKMQREEHAARQRPGSAGGGGRRPKSVGPRPGTGSQRNRGDRPSQMQYSNQNSFVSSAQESAPESTATGEGTATSTHTGLVSADVMASLMGQSIETTLLVPPTRGERQVQIPARANDPGKAIGAQGLPRGVNVRDINSVRQYVMGLGHTVSSLQAVLAKERVNIARARADLNRTRKLFVDSMQANKPTMDMVAEEFERKRTLGTGNELAYLGSLLGDPLEELRSHVMDLHGRLMRRYEVLDAQGMLATIAAGGDNGPNGNNNTNGMDPEEAIKFEADKAAIDRIVAQTKNLDLRALRVHVSEAKKRVTDMALEVQHEQKATEAAKARTLQMIIDTKAHLGSTAPSTKNDHGRMISTDK
jgi:hypothetical protein